MMRKIMSAEELEKKEHKNKVMMSVILGIIMLFSTAGYFVMDFSGQTSSKVSYNNFKFTQNEYGSWDFTVNSAAYQTLFNPQKTQNITVNSTNHLSDYTNLPLYFSGEPIEAISGSGMQEIIKNIQTIPSRVNYACLIENCSKEYVLKDCKNDNIIVFQESKNNQTSITQLDKCVTISYANQDAERAADAFLFKLLGITN